MAKKKRRPTVLNVAVERAGAKNGLRVVTFLIAWGATRQTLEREPSVEEYAVDWNVSTATAYRELKLFRETFPEFDRPGELVELMLKGTDEKLSWMAPAPREVLG